MPDVRHKRPPKEYSPKFARYRHEDWFSEESKESIEKLDEGSAEDVFQELIQRDPTVCNHCFSEKYEIEAVEYYSGKFGWERSERNNWSEGSESVPLDQPSDGTRPTCSCGHRYTHNRPVSSEKAIEFASNLSRSLFRRGIDHDPQKLVESVESLVSKPENQLRQDQSVFQASIERALND